jgi:hypothetical protein
MSGTTTASGFQQVTNYVVYHEVGATTEITIYLQSGVGHSVDGCAVSGQPGTASQGAS